MKSKISSIMIAFLVRTRQYLYSITYDFSHAVHDGHLLINITDIVDITTYTALYYLCIHIVFVIITTSAFLFFWIITGRQEARAEVGKLCHHCLANGLVTNQHSAVL